MTQRVARGQRGDETPRNDDSPGAMLLPYLSVATVYGFLLATSASACEPHFAALTI